jgi:hypothetical protein
MKKILVAVRPNDLDTVSIALGSEFDVIVCHTLEAAQRQLDADVGLIACGVRFDSGRMFELLRYAKADTRTRDVPFFLLLGSSKGYSQPILDGIRSAAKVLGASGFTDLSRLKKDIGEELAYTRLREVVRQALQVKASSST